MTKASAKRRQRKADAKDLPPKVEPISHYRFTPQEDITAYELAIVLAWVYSQIPLVNLTDELAGRDPTWLEVRRHFSKAGTETARRPN